MKIETIEKFKGSTFCVIFDNDERIYISSEIIDQFNLRVGTNIPEQAVSDIVYANDRRRARERALYLMSMRDHSFTELYNKLIKNYDEDISLEICSILKSKGIINDERYAERLSRQLFEVKRVGVFRARQEMRMKGLSDEIIENKIAKYEDSSDDILSELIEKKYARYLGDEKGQRRVQSALLRQGYTFSQIKSALREYLDDTDEY